MLPNETEGEEEREGGQRASVLKKASRNMWGRQSTQTCVACKERTRFNKKLCDVILEGNGTLLFIIRHLRNVRICRMCCIQS